MQDAPLGAFLEGETVVILGGLAAHRGYLELPWVMACAFFGTLFGDQLYYYIGRTRGKALLEKRPTWKARSNKVFHMMETHQTLLMLGFRFVYGIRTLTPFLIGTSRISPARFLLFNLIGAGIWSLTIGILGYLFGQTLEVILGDIKHYEMLIFLGLAILGAFVWYRYRN